jgi:hypothetical protein
MERKGRALMEEKKILQARDKAQASFDITSKKSLERIKEAKEREERLEELYEKARQGVLMIVEAVKTIWRGIVSKIKEIFSTYIQRGKKTAHRDNTAAPHKHIQRQHQEQARMTVSIYDQMKYKEQQRKRQRREQRVR